MGNRRDESVGWRLTESEPAGYDGASVTNRRLPDSLDRSHPALSVQRPIFIDNRDGNTLDRSIARHLQALRSESALPWGLDIATAFFNVGGFNLVADDLAGLAKVRLLLGAEPRPEAERRHREPSDPPDPHFTRLEVESALEKLERGLARERDLLPFDEESDAAVRRLLEILASGTIEVRRYERQFLHAKAYIFRTAGGGSIVGSSNLTYAGLRRNMELNLGQYDDQVVGRIESWFDELWNAAAPYDLAAVFDRLMAEFDPYLIYLRVLYELYGKELQEEEQAAGGIPVTEFQRHGIWRAQRILEKYGGVLIADGVGLGKTFIAGDIIRAYRERRQRVLLVCPAALRDTTWKKFQDRFDLKVTCVSYEELANDRHFGGRGEALGAFVDEYQLVVIDEAHNYRNPDAPMRAGVLRRLLMGKRRDLLLLSATPVNNSLWDLYELLHYFIKQDAIFAGLGVLSLIKRFNEAEKQDPFDLNPDLLYPIIDATTVKRTRKFIKRHYENDLLPQADGTAIPIQFPKPIASTIKYDLSGVLPGFIDELEEALMPEEGEPILTMARYQPGRYLLEAVDEEEERRYKALVGLLRSGLLKRFESSVHSFEKTARKMAEEHGIFLAGLDKGVVLAKDVIHEIAASDDDDLLAELIEEGDRVEPADRYNVQQLRADAENDRNALEIMATRAAGVRPEDDPKLESLREELVRIAAEAKEEGIDEEDRRRKRKVLVFSAFAHTIDWIEDYLTEVIAKDDRLAAYRGRVVSVSGEDGRHDVSRQRAVVGFAPESMEAPAPKAGEDQDRYDILLATDVLAEGMNLQQCRNIINYDLPWNPMRLVQRHGRIDRINSKHKRVFLRTIFPDADLNRLLDLEERVRRKLAQAAGSVGVETAPIEHGAQRDLSFAETRQEIERLLHDDPTIFEQGGTKGAAQTGEEYRQELRRAMMRMGDEIVGLHWKAGSGMVKGSQRGHFFCAKVEDKATPRVYLRFVPLGEGEIIRELGTCLRLIECTEDTERVVPTDLRHTAYAAWRRAQQDIHAAWTFETDSKNLQPKVPALNKEIAAFIRANPPVGMEQQRVTKALDAIEAPCARRDQKALQHVYEQDFDSQGQRSAAIIEEVERLGLEPFRTPDPLPPIEPDHIRLVCWMAIERASGGPTVGTDSAPRS